MSGSLTGKELRQLMESCAASRRVAESHSRDGRPRWRATIRFKFATWISTTLLRREPVQLSSDAIATLLEGRTVLVTGAGGSIGSEICRQVLRFRPQRLVLVERAENNLFLIEQELRRSKTETELFACIADVTDAPRIDQIFAQHQPAVVFHAAAHKHVPMMESNPGEAIKNNVLGTKQLAELADHHGVQEFVMISTDKAVNPTSVMGVSKQIAERFVHAFSEVATTKFVVVRFGNVLASAGSVVPIFQDQIRRGGPITVTHPEIERFFMTIPEASQLVLQAAVDGQRGRNLRARHGRIGADRRSGPRPDPPVGPRARRISRSCSPACVRARSCTKNCISTTKKCSPRRIRNCSSPIIDPIDLAEVNRLIEGLAAIVHEPSEVVCRRLRELIPECMCRRRTRNRRSFRRAHSAANRRIDQRQSQPRRPNRRPSDSGRQS